MFRRWRKMQYWKLLNYTIERGERGSHPLRVFENWSSCEMTDKEALSNNILFREQACLNQRNVIMILWMRCLLYGTRGSTSFPGFTPKGKEGRLVRRWKSHGNEVGVAAQWSFRLLHPHFRKYLTIIPRARMDYESIAHEAEGLMGYWLRGYEGARNIFFSKIDLVGQKNIETKHLSRVKAGHQSFFTAKTLQIWRALFATSGL